MLSVEILVKNIADKLATLFAVESARKNGEHFVVLLMISSVAENNQWSAIKNLSNILWMLLEYSEVLLNFH